MVSGNQAPPAIFAWLFIILGGGFFLVGQSLAICIIIAGRFSHPAPAFSFRFCDRVLRMFVSRSEQCWVFLRSFCCCMNGESRLWRREVTSFGAHLSQTDWELSKLGKWRMAQEAELLKCREGLVHSFFIGHSWFVISDILHAPRFNIAIDRCWRLQRVLAFSHASDRSYGRNFHR